MQKALLFLLAVLVVYVVATRSSNTTEGFQTLMGVNWTSMNEGTPKACYSDLPITQPKTPALAEAGLGAIQPSPPPASDLPAAPFGQRSTQVPSPYKDPTNEPAKYIRLLSVKEDLQAFFGFEASLLETRSDPALQIPLTRARADMAELIDVQSVMERNPGLPSRINTKQLDDIVSNLRYLRSILRDLRASGAIQETAPVDKIEGFQNLPSDQRATLKDMQDFQVKVVLELNKIKEGGSLLDNTTRMKQNVLSQLKNDADLIIDQLQRGLITPAQVPVYKFDLQQANLFLGRSANPAVNTGALPNLPSGSLPSDTRASLKELQEFQVRVVVELQRLSASGTSDPVVIARQNVLQKIKNDVDSVIQRLQEGALSPATVPIFASDLKKALPLLGNPSDPLPQILRDNDLPAGLQNLFPGGLSPKDSEQMLQINNIVKGYMKKFFDGSSWNLNLRYDNPNVEKLRFKTSENLAKLSEITKTMGSQFAASGANTAGGLPGVFNSTRPLQAQDPGASTTSASPNDAYQTRRSYDMGLPGTSEGRVLPPPPPAQLDWKVRHEQIVEQINKRGLNSQSFGGIPKGTAVSPEFSWRGQTRMMCMRLSAATDPGLAITVGCPPENFAGWTS